jgi:hypothetical protein
MPTDPFSLNLRAVSSIQAERVVANDYTIRLFGKKFQIDHGSVALGLKRSKVLMEKRLNGEIRAKYKGKYIHIHEIFHKYDIRSINSINYVN